jgi:hypothetical protein
MHVDHPPRQTHRDHLPTPHTGGLATDLAPGLDPDLASLADVIERLCTEFLARLDPPAVISTVRRCRRERGVIHGPALPELLERLARQRLHTITTTLRVVGQSRVTGLKPRRRTLQTCRRR